jgi:transposase-like protein
MTDPEAISFAPVYALDEEATCQHCGHSARDHRFVYHLAGHDRYQCVLCSCGQQYRVGAVIVHPADVATEEGRRRVIQALTGKRLRPR